MTEPKAHPYIPNMAPAVRQHMLDAIGVSSIDDLYREIPACLRLQQPMNLPAALPAEHDLKRHMHGILNKNTDCTDLISFLGGGCYTHDVPAVCDEVNSRSEFLTAYAGEPYDDHGRFQAMFEYTSMMTEILNMEIVSVPVYDGLQASATAARICGQLSGRKTVLVAENINTDTLDMMRGYARPAVHINTVAYDQTTGQIDIYDLQQKLDHTVAGVFFANPNFFGVIEHGKTICDMAHACQAKAVVCIDPITTSYMTPPADYGADIVCGDIQSLGMHMQYGAGQAGFYACHDDADIVNALPCRLFGVAPTQVAGEYGFGDIAYYRTSFDKREQGNEWVGTAAALWGITAGVYLASLGPHGFRELGHTVLHRTLYAKDKINSIHNVSVQFAGSGVWREFVVDFSKSGKTVQQINTALLQHGFLGGHDLGDGFKHLQHHALYAVTECCSQQDIDGLCHALDTIINGQHM